MPAVRIESLSKRYRLGTRVGSRDSLRDKIASRMPAPIREKGQPREGARDGWFWALEDVSFEVAPGEVVGIIGSNGAGKTTLLKILSRITEPTAGRAELRGRVGSLLEVGTGFHPELTGRENTFLNGALLGMSKGEVRKKFDEIVDFSGVEKFIDTPVKRYSSGMYVRLAFAVAAHLEPEILLVDEVLAVGDMDFQRKCLGKMRQVGESGRTILFVSHNMQAVSTLTQRCVVMEQGRCLFDGPTGEGIRRYLEAGGVGGRVYEASPSSQEARVTRVEVVTSEPNGVQINGRPMEVRLEIHAPYPLERAAVAFQAVTSLQQPHLNLWLYDSERPLCREPGVYELTCRIPKVRLYMGRYTLTVHFSERLARKSVQKIEGICPFEVTMYGRHRDFAWQPGTCAYLEDAEWDVQRTALVVGEGAERG